MRTVWTILAACLCLVLLAVAALALRAGSMKPAAVAEEWEEFREKTVRPIREHGLFGPWHPTEEEMFQEEGFLREEARSPIQSSGTPSTRAR